MNLNFAGHPYSQSFNPFLMPARRCRRDPLIALLSKLAAFSTGFALSVVIALHSVDASAAPQPSHQNLSANHQEK